MLAFDIFSCKICTSMHKKEVIMRDNFTRIRLKNHMKFGTTGCAVLIARRP